MDTIKISKTQTKLIAHRGLSGIECENSLPAFVAAANRSYYGIETDIHITTDGRFVILHDSKTTRVSDTEVDVENQTFDEIKDVLLKDPRKHDGDVVRRDLVLPTLEEYLCICKKYDKIAVIEIKCDMTGCVETLLETVKRYHSLDKSVFISFGWKNVEAIKKVRPEQKVQFLCCDWKDELLEKLIEYKIDLDIYHPAVTKELIDLLHQNGIEINAWTVDTPETAQRLIEWGIDYITSNILE